MAEAAVDQRISEGTLQDLQFYGTQMLYDDGIWQRALVRVEEKCGIKSEHIVYAALIAYAFYLITGYYAELLCNLTGYAYPAYKTMLALQTETKDDDTQWLTYWTIFGLLNLIDFGANKMFEKFPVYWLSKCCLLIWLWSPITKGSNKVFNKLLMPFIDKYQLAFTQIGSLSDSIAEKFTGGGMLQPSAAIENMHNKTVEKNE